MALIQWLLIGLELNIKCLIYNTGTMIVRRERMNRTVHTLVVQTSSNVNNRNSALTGRLLTWM